MDFQVPELQLEQVVPNSLDNLRQKLKTEKVNIPRCQDLINKTPVDRENTSRLLEYVHISESAEDSEISQTTRDTCNVETCCGTEAWLPGNLCLRDSTKGTPGVFAKSNIKKGDIVLEEEPLIMCLLGEHSDFPACSDEAMVQMQQEIQNASKETRRKLQDLSQCSSEEVESSECYGKLCLPIEDGWGTAIFSVGSRMSHSCTPSVEQVWDSSTGKARFIANRDIAESDQITISYVDTFSSTKVRQEQLEDKFSFKCTCDACSKSYQEIHRSDKRRKKIRVLDQKISKAIKLEEYECSLHYAKERMKLLQTEGLDSPKNLLRCEYDAFRSSLYLGNLKDSERYFQLACKHSNETYGEESKHSCKLMRQAQDLEFQRAMCEVIYDYC